jgi:uncharacterized membrane protein
MQYLAQAGGFGRHFGERGGDHGWAGGLFILFFLAALVAVVVLLVVRFSGRGGHQHAAVAPTPGAQPVVRAAPVVDEAVAHLRLRYARGEVSRDEFVRTSADLGAPVPSSSGSDPTAGM